MYHTEIGKDINRAIAFLKQDELVAIPTETVYGLAGNGLSEKAIARIYEAKNRPQFNPLILHIAGVAQADRLVREMPLPCRKLMEKFSPGPITFLLPKKDAVPDLVTAGSDLVAIRIPDHPLTRLLLSQLDFPLAAPSANPSGYVSPVTASHVMEGLGGRIPYILDGGACRVGLESTIVGFSDCAVVVYRLGAISVEQIEGVAESPVAQQLTHASPLSPGQLKSHYATQKPLFRGNITALAALHPEKKLGIISFRNDYEIENAFVRVLSREGDLEHAASELFKTMREFDKSDVDVILAEIFPDVGIGKAINDRLERAAFT